MPNKHRKSRETRWPREAGGGEQQEMGPEVLGGQQDRRLAPGGHCKSLAVVPSDVEELRADVATLAVVYPCPSVYSVRQEGRRDRVDAERQDTLQ